MDELTLIKYIKGSLDEISHKKVEEWILLSEENKKQIEDLYVVMFVNDRMVAKNTANTNKAYEEFKNKNISNKKVVVLWRKIATVAAVTVILLFSSTYATLFILDKNTAPTLVTTNLGERAQIELPDGSKVWLNAFSSVTYKKSILSRKRHVALTGEAYFDVAHKKTPFIVSNNSSEIEVLGTKFNVRCNEDEDFLQATLMEGSIRFSDTNIRSKTILKPSEELVFDKNTHQLKVKKINEPKDILSWINGKLIFENASLEEIAKSLERYYNVDIHFTDESVMKERFNAEFEISDNIYQILSVLELTNKFTYTIEKRDILISSKK